jgi:hypothetical protein
MKAGTDRRSGLRSKPPLSHLQRFRLCGFDPTERDLLGTRARKQGAQSTASAVATRPAPPALPVLLAVRSLRAFASNLDLFFAWPGVELTSAALTIEVDLLVFDGQQVTAREAKANAATLRAEQVDDLMAFCELVEARPAIAGFEAGFEAEIAERKCEAFLIPRTVGRPYFYPTFARCSPAAPATHALQALLNRPSGPSGLPHQVHAGTKGRTEGSPIRRRFRVRPRDSRSPGPSK